MLANRFCKSGAIIFLVSILSLTSCVSDSKTGSLFEALDSGRTGLHFNNKLTYDKDFNLFKYMYFYNGSGIGAGDFNNDGLIDLFFAANQQPNRLYLNSGGLRFSDVTTAARIPADDAWSTGVSVVDINNDGLLDIYVCRVGNFERLQSRNQFLINQGIGDDGIPVFVDRAKEYGLDFSGFSTQAAFFDYDNDGDLDMYLLNHSLRESGSFRPMKEFMERRSEVSGDRLYRNDGTTFTEVTEAAGIASCIGYGLGISVADIDLDGYPDIYIGNDFQENDFLYINQRNGTFREEGEQRMMHTSQFSMGVDVADINNDAYPEIISADMLPSDPNMLKRSLGEDAYDVSHYKTSIGYSHQYSRNNLQLNRRNGMFTETGLYSGIYATDWSWAPLWFDFDNDGLKDLFVSNGIPKRLNDIDYINFIASENVQLELRYNNPEEVNMSLVDKFPEIKLPNKFFRNNGDLVFSDQADGIGPAKATFSNGAVYADLDNDGDLDIVVNNIDDPAIVYENKSAQPGIRSSLQIGLKGPASNRHAVGARIIVYADNEMRSYENFAARGFLSSMQIPLHIGLGKTKIDSIALIWPDRTYQLLSLDSSARINVAWQEGLPPFDFGQFTRKYKSNSKPVMDITEQAGLRFKHEENRFIEFNREPLIPHELSTEGPAIAIADIDHNGLEDVFIGAARTKKRAVYLQEPAGRFVEMRQPALAADSAFEDIDATWIDVNKDGHADLVVASGGNEFFGNDIHNAPRVYLNDGKGTLSRKWDAFNGIYLTASCVVPIDINSDGHIDLFIGARAVPNEYGSVPKSYLLVNDGTGKFTDRTDAFSAELAHAGFVTSAQVFDLDKDGKEDLVISLEWGGIVAFLNRQGKLVRDELTTKKGWWNFVKPCDIDNDGDIDLIAGNLGMNSRLSASGTHPLRMYYNDFDNNGRMEQVLTYYLGDREIPFANKAELEKQIPELRKRYLYAADFAKASLQEIFGAAKLQHSAIFTADYLSSAILVNDGKGKFETRALPWQAQLSVLRDAEVLDANGDSHPDILLVGNYYGSNISMGRYDGDYGTLLLNDGKGWFTVENLKDLAIKGESRRIKPVMLGERRAFIVARNNDKAVVVALVEN